MSSFEERLRQLEGDVAGDLVEQRRVDAPVDFTRWENDPIGFMREVLRFEPWSAQVEVAESVRDHELVSVAGCNAAGKDAIAAQLALWWVYACGGLVLLSSATMKQVKDASMVEVARAFSRARGRYALPGDLFQMSLRLDGEPRLLAFTSTESSRLTGYHQHRILAILSEAQAVEDFGYEGMMSCATGPQDRLLAVGNPVLTSGRFYTAHMNPSSPWKAIRISAEEHPNVVEGRTVIPGGPSRAWTRRMAAEWGRHSNMYRSRVLAEFPDQGEESLIARSWVEDAMARGEAASAPPATLEPILAVDVAQYGPDRTVVGVRRGDSLERFVVWGNASIPETVRRVADVAVGEGFVRWAEWGMIVVDDVGMGTGVADGLKELGYRVRRFNGGYRGGLGDRFLNVRAQAFWRVRDLLESGKLRLPRDSSLAEELVAIRWHPTTENKVQIEPKVQLKGRLGRSPDRADCVSMAFWKETFRPFIMQPFL